MRRHARRRRYFRADARDTPAFVDAFSLRRHHFPPLSPFSSAPRDTPRARVMLMRHAFIRDAERHHYFFIPPHFRPVFSIFAWFISFRRR